MVNMSPDDFSKGNRFGGKQKICCTLEQIPGVLRYGICWEFLTEKQTCTQTDCNQPEMMMIGYDSWLSGESREAIVEQLSSYSGAVSSLCPAHT